MCRHLRFAYKRTVCLTVKKNHRSILTNGMKDDTVLIYIPARNVISYVNIVNCRKCTIVCGTPIKKVLIDVNNAMLCTKVTVENVICVDSDVQFYNDTIGL